MDVPAFAVTYDYRCPFARNVHEHLVTALRAGAAWEVEFVPFSLSQAHVDEGGVAVWDDPGQAADHLAMEASIVVAERHPDRFLDVHEGFFTARHDQGRDLRDGAVVRAVLVGAGLDADEILGEVAAGWPREAFRKAHEGAVGAYKVFGVPTFVTGGRGVFVRLMTRPAGDADVARSTIERVVRLVGDAPELNEFKHTSIER